MTSEQPSLNGRELDNKEKSTVHHNDNTNTMITFDKGCSLATDKKGKFRLDKLCLNTRERLTVKGNFSFSTVKKME